MFEYWKTQEENKVFVSTRIPFLKPLTQLALLYANHSEFDRRRKSLAIFATDRYGNTWQIFSSIATMWHFSLDPKFHRVTFKNCAKLAQTKVNKPNGDSEAKKIVGCCHNFATRALQEVF